MVDFVTKAINFSTLPKSRKGLPKKNVVTSSLGANWGLYGKSAGAVMRLPRILRKK